MIYRLIQKYKKTDYTSVYNILFSEFKIFKKPDNFAKKFKIKNQDKEILYLTEQVKY